MYMFEKTNGTAIGAAASPHGSVPTLEAAASYISKGISYDDRAKALSSCTLTRALPTGDHGRHPGRRAWPLYSSTS